MILQYYDSCHLCTKFYKISCPFFRIDKFLIRSYHCINDKTFYLGECIMSTTIKDIANAVNISTAAVSLVLNNKPCRISEEKKELIRRTAQEMDYQPNRNAVALVTSRTMIIGTIVYDVSNAYFAEFAKGVEDTAADFEYQILLVNINNRKNKAKNYAKILGYNSTDALIVESNLDDPELEKYVNYYYNSKNHYNS